MAYTWSKDVETGVAAIDSQHKEWFVAFNELMDACSRGKGRDSIRSTLRFLQDYTAKHFGDEEALQVRYRYPDYQAHRQYHEAFKKVVSDIVTEYDRSGPTVALVAKINTSLGGWFVNHIKKEDAKLAEHIRRAGA